jgi:hypothetical protein
MIYIPSSTLRLSTPFNNRVEGRTAVCRVDTLITLEVVSQAIVTTTNNKLITACREDIRVGPSVDQRG